MFRVPFSRVRGVVTRFPSAASVSRSVFLNSRANSALFALRGQASWFSSNSNDQDKVVDAEFSETPAADANATVKTGVDVAAEAMPEDNTIDDLDLEKLGMVKPDADVDETKAKPENTEEIEGSPESHTFQAETRKILDIVANSIYTDKEVFLRELVSNASDALEKARYLRSQDDSGISQGAADGNLEIRIFTDPDANTLTIQDFGIGMDESDLQANLGTIARSGSKEFIQQLQDSKSVGAEAADNIIGQFGVGFYSAFMVGDSVDVYSRKAGEEDGFVWSSTGDGSFTLAKCKGVQQGTKIVIHLKKTQQNFASDHVIAGIIKKYSNFVGFPIHLNGKIVNTVQAIWTMSKAEVTEEQHTEFYRYVSQAYDNPTFRMHFQTDAPLNINALFYFPERHMEKFGMGRMDPGCSLYSRKVLIQPKCKAILPDWLRFVKGVVDSEDLPLNLSRESMQDSVLISRLNNVLTKRCIKFLADQAKSDADKYNTWFEEFGVFIKEGVCSDFQNKDGIGKLLRFESSNEEGVLTSLDDYIGRMPLHQEGIYYLCAPNRELALSSPYYETFQKDNVEVLFLYAHIDDFVMQNLTEYGKRKLLSVEKGNVSTKAPDADKESEEKKKDETKTEEQKQKEEEEKKDQQLLVSWLKDALSDKVSEISTTDRLVSSPAIVVDHESAAVRRMMKMVDGTGQTGMGTLARQKLEINPKHPIMSKLLKASKVNPMLAKTIAEQVYDNALMAADILDNPRSMLPRINDILASALDTNSDDK